MWIMPSFGRPEALRRLLDAPGGWPDQVLVLINNDDPEHARYWEALNDLWKDEGRKVPWALVPVPAGSRFASAVHTVYKMNPNDSFYGIIDDDYWPVTPSWHEKMVAAAGGTHIALANNLQNFPKPYCCRVMGGDLARAIGTIAPGKMEHNYSDDAWGRFAADFDLLVPLEDVIVEHRHHLFNPDVAKDKTYERGSGDFGRDTELYREWLNSDERRAQCDRVGALLGRNITATDLTKVKLAICVPIQDSDVDVAFHLSLHNMMTVLHRKGVDARIVESAGGSHIGKARERVLWLAMNGDFPATHIFYVDSDMGWDADLIIRLICADHDFAAAVGRKKQDEVAYCFNPYDPPVFHPVTGFAAAQHVGFAFVLLKRKVIELLCQSYPDLEYDTDEGPREWALFFDILWKSGRRRLPERLSEDYSFCQRWRDIGGNIWIDIDAELTHAGRKEYKGKPRDILKVEEVPSAA